MTAKKTDATSKPRRPSVEMDIELSKRASKRQLKAAKKPKKEQSSRRDIIKTAQGDLPAATAAATTTTAACTETPPPEATSKSSVQQAGGGLKKPESVMDNNDLLSQPAASSVGGVNREEEEEEEQVKETSASTGGTTPKATMTKQQKQSRRSSTSSSSSRSKKEKPNFRWDKVMKEDQKKPMEKSVETRISLRLKQQQQQQEEEEEREASQQETKASSKTKASQKEPKKTTAPTIATAPKTVKQPSKLDPNALAQVDQLEEEVAKQEVKPSSTVDYKAEFAKQQAEWNKKKNSSQQVAKAQDPPTASSRKIQQPTQDPSKPVVTKQPSKPNLELVNKQRAKEEGEEEEDDDEETTRRASSKDELARRAVLPPQAELQDKEKQHVAHTNHNNNKASKKATGAATTISNRAPTVLQQQRQQNNKGSLQSSRTGTPKQEFYKVLQTMPSWEDTFFANNVMSAKLHGSIMVVFDLDYERMLETVDSDSDDLWLPCPCCFEELKEDAKRRIKGAYLNYHVAVTRRGILFVVGAHRIGSEVIHRENQLARFQDIERLILTQKKGVWEVEIKLYDDFSFDERVICGLKKPHDFCRLVNAAKWVVQKHITTSNPLVPKEIPTTWKLPTNQHSMMMTSAAAAAPTTVSMVRPGNEFSLEDSVEALEATGHAAELLGALLGF